MNLNKIIYGQITFFHLIIALCILVLAVFFARALSLYLRRTLREKVSKDHLEIIAKIVNYSIIVIAVISAFAILGINLSGLLLAGSMAGIILGFASQNIVGNLLSGFFLIIERPVKIGDQVSIDDLSGYVEDIRIISTTIRTYDGLYVRIPNQKVFTSNTVNYVAHVARRVQYLVGIRYSDDADKAYEIIRKTIESHPYVLVNPNPDIFVNELGDNSMEIVVRFWAPSQQWYSAKMALLWKIKTELEKEGIEIAFPQRTVWFANHPESRE